MERDRRRPRPAWVAVDHPGEVVEVAVRPQRPRLEVAAGVVPLAVVAAAVATSHLPPVAAVVVEHHRSVHCRPRCCQCHRLPWPRWPTERERSQSQRPPPLGTVRRRQRLRRHRQHRRRRRSSASVPHRHPKTAPRAAERWPPPWPAAARKMQWPTTRQTARLTTVALPQRTARCFGPLGTRPSCRCLLK